MVGGLGLTLIVLALALGVVGDATVNTNLVSLALLTGLALLVFAIGGWTGYVQPYKNFDDINQPLVDDHHGHADAHAEH